jgi:hypothetical protein
MRRARPWRHGASLVYAWFGYLSTGSAVKGAFVLGGTEHPDLSSGDAQGIFDWLGMLFYADMMCLERVVSGLPQTTNAPSGQQAPATVVAILVVARQSMDNHKSCPYPLRRALDRAPSLLGFQIKRRYR